MTILRLSTVLRATPGHKQQQSATRKKGRKEFHTPLAANVPQESGIHDCRYSTKAMMPRKANCWAYNALAFAHLQHITVPRAGVCTLFAICSSRLPRKPASTSKHDSCEKLQLQSDQEPNLCSCEPPMEATGWAVANMQDGLGLPADKLCSKL